MLCEIDWVGWNKILFDDLTPGDFCISNGLVYLVTKHSIVNGDPRNAIFVEDGLHAYFSNTELVSKVDRLVYYRKIIPRTE